MILEVKKFIFVCDECKKNTDTKEFTNEIEKNNIPPYPEGWKSITIHNCYGTGYYDYEYVTKFLCPTCQLEKNYKNL